MIDPQTPATALLCPDCGHHIHLPKPCQWPGCTGHPPQIPATEAGRHEPTTTRYMDGAGITHMRQSANGCVNCDLRWDQHVQDMTPSDFVRVVAVTDQTPATEAGRPTRYAMVGDLNNRHMAPAGDGNYVLWLDYAEARADERERIAQENAERLLAIPAIRSIVERLADDLRAILAEPQR